MRKLFFITTILSIALTNTAYADTTGRLYKYCLDFPRKELNRYYCEGYVNGVRDVAVVKRALIGCNEKEPLLAKVHPDRIIEHFLDWAKKHPDSWDEPAYSGMLNVLDEQYPCNGGEVR